MPRIRRRSRRRKVAEALVLALGVPALLFVVLALSVELIEYRPASSIPQQEEQKVAMPVRVLEIPPIRAEPLDLTSPGNDPLDIR